MLSSAGASLAELSPEILSDGGEERSRGAAPAITSSDPDLLRIRKVRITVRVQAEPRRCAARMPPCSGTLAARGDVIAFYRTSRPPSM